MVVKEVVSALMESLFTKIGQKVSLTNTGPDISLVEVGSQPIPNCFTHLNHQSLYAV